VTKLKRTRIHALLPHRSGTHELAVISLLGHSIAQTPLKIMDQLTITAASGMRSRIEALDLLANNLANTGTTGYKADREFYNLYVSSDADTQTTLPNIERNWIDYSQGIVKETGNPLDVALAGKGFLTVDSPTGPLYTRNGSFRLSPTGILETAEGYSLRANTPTHKIQANPTAGPLQIQKDGSVLQDGQILGVLTLADWTGSNPLQKRDGLYFQWTDSTRPPAIPANIEVLQGRLEGSNAGPAEAAVKLVGVLRQFEMLQKAMNLGAEMNRKAVEDVARVTG
jgi:flagellar basal-body rod protein FlgF